jgi:hypothetical protein
MGNLRHLPCFVGDSDRLRTMKTKCKESAATWRGGSAELLLGFWRGGAEGWAKARLYYGTLNRACMGLSEPNFFSFELVGQIFIGLFPIFCGSVF